VVAALRVVIVFWRIDVEVSHRVNTNLFCLSLMLTSPDLGTVLSMVEPSSVLSNSESLGRLTGTFLLFLLPLQATAVVPRTHFVPVGQLFPVPIPAPAATVVQLAQPESAGSAPTQDNAVPRFGGQPVPVGAAVVLRQGQVVGGGVQRVAIGQTAVATVEVSTSAPTLTALHLQATGGAFITICQVHAVPTEVPVPAVHVPKSVGPVLVQGLVQPVGGLRTQASSLPGVAAVAVIDKASLVHPIPTGAIASEEQAHAVAVAVTTFLHVTPAQVAPSAATAVSSVVPAVGHVQVVGKGFDGTIAKAQAAVALHTEPAAPVA